METMARRTIQVFGPRARGAASHHARFLRNSGCAGWWAPELSKMSLGSRAPGNLPCNSVSMRLPAPVVRQAASAFAALLVATTSAPPAAFAAPPTVTELSRLQLGLARVDFLLDNWDKLTTVCNAASTTGPDEDKQVVGTMNQNKCYKTPLNVQKYVGAASTKDPLFKAEKLMIAAQPTVPEERQEAYISAVDAFTTQQQMSAIMAYTSSWSGFENPGGSAEAIDEALLETKKEVKNTQQALSNVIKLLDLPEFKLEITD